MDWKIWLPISIAAIGSLYQVLSYYQAKRATGQGAISMKSPYVIPGVIMLLTWGAVAYDLYDRHYSSLDSAHIIQNLKGDTSIVKLWGLVDHEEGKPYQVQLIADGKRILSYDPSYQSNYRLAVLCFRTDGTKDHLDIDHLQKSALYDIQDGSIHIIVTTDDAYVEEWKRGDRMTNYFLFLVPKGVEMSHFSTIRQAQALGAIQIAGRAGPP